MAEFVLKPDNRNVSEASLIEDIQGVAARLGRAPTLREYSANGRYSASIVRRACGTWNVALGKAGFSPNVESKVDIDSAVADLLRLEELLGHPPSIREYDELGAYSSKPLKTHFGTWNKMLAALGLTVRFESAISTERLWTNLEEVWVRLGRQPSWAEMSGSESNFSARVYARRFGTWHNALQTFVDFMNTDDEPEDRQIEQNFGEEESIARSIDSPVGASLAQRSRNISLRMRFRVMRRDRFTCVACGRSPAKDPTVELQIDHIVAWSKGGNATMDNLQTLCTVCNLGKSDLDFVEP